MNKKENVIILGKVPPPYMGPSIATEIILNSTLNEHYNLIHADTKINSHIKSMGSFSFNKVVRNLKLYINLFNLILKYKPELVLIPISQTKMGFIKDSLYILISKILKRKILIHLRGSDFKNFYDKSGKLNKVFIRGILHYCNGVIVLGNNLKYIFKDFFKDNEIFVVPNGANYNLPDKEYIKIKKLNMLYLANLLPAKGIEDIIDAFILLSNNSNNIHLNVVGNWVDETTKNNCINKVKKYNLPVTFHLPVGLNDKLTFFQKSDLFLFTPRKPEGHPWVLVEAMAASLPIIATDQGAIIESVIDNSNGFIVEAYSPTQISEKILFFLNNKIKVMEMGKKSREIYTENFTEETMVNNLHFVFDTIITKKEI